MAEKKDLVDEFLRASLTAERRRRWRTRAIVVGVLAVVSTLAVVASCSAIQAQRQASDLEAAATTDWQRLIALGTSQAETERERDLAVSRQLATQSGSHLDDQLDLALLLAVEAVNTASTAEARQALLDALRYQPRLISMLRGQLGSVTSIAFSPGGRWLATGSCDIGSGNEGGACFGPAEIRLWDLSVPSSPVASSRPFTNAVETIGDLAVSEDGKMLASCDPWEETITVWNLSDPGAPSLTATQPTSEINCDSGLAVSSEGVVSRLWDESDLVAQALEEKGVYVAGAACSQDWARCVGTVCPNWTGEVCEQSDILLWDFSRPESIRELSIPIRPLPGEVFGRAVSPDGQLLALGGCYRRDSSGSCDLGQIWLWDISERPSPATELWAGQYEGPPGWVTDVAFRPDGHLLASVGCATAQEYEEGCGTRDEIRLWAVPAPGRVQPVGVPLDGPEGRVTEIAFSLDGNTLAACTADGGVSLWDVPDSGAPVSLGAPTAGAIDCLSPFTVEADGTISAVAGRTDVPADLHAGPTRAAIAPDGRTAASFFRDITLWDVSGPGSPVQLGAPLLGYRNFRFVTGVAFSSDSLLMAASTCDSMEGEPCFPTGLRLWDISNPRSPVLLGAPVTGPAGEPVDLAFSPDGGTLAASSYQAIMLWEVGTGTWQDRACQLAGRDLSEEEWRQYLGNREYQPTCPDLPMSEQAPTP